MGENAKGAAELNRAEQERRNLEEATQELNEVKRKLNNIDLPKGFKPISIAKYKEVKVSEQIAEKDVIAVELENEEQERQMQLYKELEGQRLLLIATINEKNEAILSDEYQKVCEERYKGYIRKKDLQQPYEIDQAEMEKQKEAEIDPEAEQENTEPSKTSEEIEIATKLGVPPSQILNVVEVKDEEGMSNALNKELATKKLYAVRLKTSAGRLTSNEWVMVQKDSNGNYERAMREDPSDTLQTMGHELGIRSTTQNDTIEDGEINAEANPYDDKTHVEVRRNRFTDGNTYVMEIDTVNKAVLHVYKEENGKLVPLCKEEHGNHEHAEIELPDRTLEVEDDDERTPWGDAENRRKRY